jgi:hypothetical protein
MKIDNPPFPPLEKGGMGGFECYFLLTFLSHITIFKTQQRPSVNILQPFNHVGRVNIWSEDELIPHF